MKRPPGVVFSAVLLLLGSLFQLVIAFGMGLSGAFLPRSAGGRGLSGGAYAAGPMPSWMPMFMYVLCAFFIALALWGVLTMVGLFRLRSWARYSVLVIAGGMALIGLISMATTVLMLFVPLPQAPNVGASHAASVQAMVRVIFGVVAFFYGIICAVGVSWLVYFTRKNVRAVFAGGNTEVLPSRRPLLISLIAVFNMVGAVGCLLTAFLPIPVLIFGLILHGWEKVAVYLVYSGLMAAVGAGLWRLEEWGRRLTLGVIVVGVVQSLVFLVRPSSVLRYSAELDNMMGTTQTQLPMHFQTMLYSASFAFSVLFCIAIAATLIHYRGAFQRPIEPYQNGPSAI